MVSYIRGSDNFDSANAGSTTFGDVGSYAWAGLTTFASHTITEGTTTAGSNLSPGGVYAYAGWGGVANGVNAEDGSHTSVYQKQNGSLSGTWRCMGFAQSYDSGRAGHTLWVRIS